MKITAVIPIRTGSQRVKDKNLRQFGDTTLMEHKIKSLLQVPELDRIVVNTNSIHAIRIVEGIGIGKLSCYLREEYFASSKCSGSDFFHHLGEVTDTDVFVYSPCTSPFIKPETVSACISKYLSRNAGTCDCVSTVSSVKDFLWQDGKAINYNPQDAPNSQNLPDIVSLNFGCSVISREDLIRYRNIIASKPEFVVTSEIESLDIDTPLDFFLAEQLYLKAKVQPFILDGATEQRVEVG